IFAARQDFVPRASEAVKKSKKCLTSGTAMIYFPSDGRREAQHGLPVHGAGDSAGWQEPSMVSDLSRALGASPGDREGRGDRVGGGGQAHAGVEAHSPTDRGISRAEAGA